MQNSWFKWEREASIHLLFPTLEGSMQPFKEYVGFGFPTTILIFKDGVVTWCMEEQELYNFGAKLRKIYFNPKKEQELVRDIKISLKDLKKIEAKIVSTSLNQLADKQLVLLYNELYKSFLRFYAIGAISTPLSFETEVYLKNKLHLTDEQVTTLGAPTKDSYSKKAEAELVKTRDIDKFLAKYFWLNNNYSGTQMLSKSQAELILKQAKTTQKAQKQSELAIYNKEVTQEATRLLELLSHYAVYKDDRKKEILIFLHHFELLLSEVSKRSKISLELLRSTFPNEVADVLSGKLTSTEIEQRKKLCVVEWKANQMKPKILTGKSAEVWEDKLLKPKLAESKVIKGNIASKGKAIGKVRILLSAKDCGLFQEGEILVTFMTSPDFMPAMRKAAAIITNLGGVTSHAAIISRELNIPCIIGTKVATQVLKTGDLVEVDADNGIVKILN